MKLNQKVEDERSIFETEAFLWNGSAQLPGTLLLTRRHLLFYPHGFQKSHLQIKILLSDLKVPQIFLVYDVARNGVRLSSKNGAEDLFIIPELDAFLRTLKSVASRF